MEEINLQQIKSLESILDYQQIKIDLYLTYLTELANIEANFITFGKLSNKEQKRKESILINFL